MTKIANTMRINVANPAMAIKTGTDFSQKGGYLLFVPDFLFLSFESWLFFIDRLYPGASCNINLILTQHTLLLS
jgi:hypothetical protein